MSLENKTQEAIEKAREATEFTPFVEMVEAISKDNDGVKKRIADVEEKLEKKVERTVGDLESKVEKSVADIMAAVERTRVWNKTSAMGAAIEGVQQLSLLRDAIPDSVKQWAGRFEAATLPQLKGNGSNGHIKQTEVAMAVHAWFVRATQAQFRGNASQLGRIAREMDALRDALEVHHFGDKGTAEKVLKAALAEDAAATGGNLVPTIVGAEVLRLVRDASILAPLCRPWPMTKKVEQVPNEASAVTVNWVDEAGTLTGGDPTFGQKTLTAEKLAGRATLSIELFEDSNVALLPFLLAVFTEKMAGELDKQLVLGDGSGPQITGIMNASGINAITSGTAAGRALTWQLLVDTFCGASEGSARDGGVWIVSPRGYAKLLGLVDSQLRPIIQQFPPEAPAGTLLGRRIIESARFGGTPSGVPSTLDDNTNSATKIVFGPPRTVLFGERMGMRWDVTDQVNWAAFQMDCRLVGRFAGNVGVPSAWSYLGQVDYVP